MNRRTFLKYSGASVVVIAAGVGGYLTFFREGERQLANRLQPLFDPLFQETAAGRQPDNLVTELMAKGVIDEKERLNSSALQDLAKTDEAVGYNGRYYTKTELELYSLAYLLGEKYSFGPD